MIGVPIASALSTAQPEIVTVSVTKEPLVGDSIQTAGGAPLVPVGIVKLITALAELLPSVAVIVALWLLAIVPAAIALNDPVNAPAAMITDAGTIRKLLLLDSATTAPPAGAT